VKLIRSTSVVFSTALLALGFGAGSTAIAAGRGAPPAAPTSSTGVHDVLATYPGGNTVGAEPRKAVPDSRGYHHIDTAATLSRLKQLHVNTYFYLVWHQPTDWPDFTDEFLPAAERAGIKVWVYIVPPSECTTTFCSDPYRTDYLAWANAIAKQSTKHPNLVGWAIDDFASSANTAILTPGYLEQVHQAGRQINPKLNFFTLLYSTQITPGFFSSYGKAIDGVIFAFRDDPYHDTQWSGTLRGQLDDALSVTDTAGKPLLFMPYLNKLTNAPLIPDAQYTEAVIRVGMSYLRAGRIGGIVAYGTPLEGQAQDDERHAHTGAGRLSLAVAGYGKSTAGGYAQAQETITTDPAGDRWLHFWHQNRVASKAAPGTRRLQVLIGNTVLFDHDVSGDPTGAWIEEKVDLTKALSGHGHARLAIRLTDTAPQTAAAGDVGIDDLRLAGGQLHDADFEEQRDWSLSRTDGPFLPKIDLYDPQRPAHVFGVVARYFARG
jgi:hypothetical protein